MSALTPSTGASGPAFLSNSVVSAADAARPITNSTLPKFFSALASRWVIEVTSASDRHQLRSGAFPATITQMRTLGGGESAVGDGPRGEESV
jgi:hypothetical protein